MTRHTDSASEPGSLSVPNEDIALLGPDFFIVLDGLTARIETGCNHGVPWYVATLADTLSTYAADYTLEDLLRMSIDHVADLHRDTCDLSAAGTPAAAIGLVRIHRDHLSYLVLGDVSLAFDLGSEVQVITDSRMRDANAALQVEVNLLAANSPHKEAALIRMKQAELAIRNTQEGYWVAAAQPEAAEHALTGEIAISNVLNVALLTDGAARCVDLFGTHTWSDVFKILEDGGAATLLQEVRAIERSDPLAQHWPRNKVSDDATVIFCHLGHDGQGVLST